MARTKHDARKQISGKQSWYGFKSSTKATKAVPVRKQSSVVVKQKRRYHPGTVALREIRKYQNTVDSLIPKLPFQRLVRNIAQSMFLSLIN